jgi:hypothetical protein
LASSGDPLIVDLLFAQMFFGNDDSIGGALLPRMLVGGLSRGIPGFSGCLRHKLQPASRYFLLAPDGALSKSGLVHHHAGTRSIT